MAEQNFVVRANRLNFRKDPGLEADILWRLARGTSVELIDGGQADSWWKVKPSGTDTIGYVARRFLAPISGAATLDHGGINGVLWDATAQAEGRVSYKLGDKDSAAGRIDCSGWVAEITIKSFAAINAAAAPEVVFDKYDNGVLRNHSDGIVTGLAAHTGFIIRGAQVTPSALRDGMLIGINFATYNWEINDPPRKYGIDHIVQVMSDPATGEKFITQSSGSGHGVNKVKLDDWLDARTRDGLVAANRVYAVDPLLLADPNTHYAQRPAVTAAAPLASAAPHDLDAPHAAFAGRGMYVYTVSGLLHTYGTLENCVREMQRCRLQHIWVRINGRGYVGDEKGVSPARQQALIAAARAAGIAVAGWGWCQGEDPHDDAELALRAMSVFDVDDYVADIEWGVNGADWTSDEVVDFVKAMRDGMNDDAALAVSSHGFIEYQKPQIFKKAAPLIDYFNPQAYWFEDKPNAKMLKSIKASEDEYPLHDPASYARLCFDRWSELYDRPIILTGQVAPEADLTALDAEGQLKRFLMDFDAPEGLFGLNYWHWGSTTKAERDLLASVP